MVWLPDGEITRSITLPEDSLKLKLSPATDAGAVPMAKVVEVRPVADRRVLEYGVGPRAQGAVEDVQRYAACGQVKVRLMLTKALPPGDAPSV